MFILKIDESSDLLTYEVKMGLHSILQNELYNFFQFPSFPTWSPPMLTLIWQRAAML